MTDNRESVVIPIRHYNMPIAEWYALLAASAAQVDAELTAAIIDPDLAPDLDVAPEELELIDVAAGPTLRTRHLALLDSDTPAIPPRRRVRR